MFDDLKIHEKGYLRSFVPFLLEMRLFRREGSIVEDVEDVEEYKKIVR